MERITGPLLPELRALLLDMTLRMQMKRVRMSVSDVGLRRQAVRFHQSMRGAVTPPFVKIERERIAGCPAEWLETDSASPSGDWRVPSASSAQSSARSTPGEGTKKVVLYFHGGGFFMSSPEGHRPLTWRIARATRRRVLAIDYRKAPDHAFPAWLDDAFAAYEELLARGHAPRDIVLSGDSAGGNIALAVAHRIRTGGRVPMPDALVLFSPWADILCEGGTYETNRRRDAMFDGHAVRALGRYLTRHCDPRDPSISPIHSDFRGFPRMLLFAGSTEVFLDDARAVARRASLAGVEAELHVYRHLPHVFPMFAGVVPRAKLAFEVVKEFVDRGARA